MLAGVLKAIKKTNKKKQYPMSDQTFPRQHNA